jgi:endonuclease YncB( thermonuclease family)
MIRLAVLLLLFPAAAWAEARGPALVIDGDTLEVAGQRFRLYGIDAPEPGQVCALRSKTIRCGYIAKTALMDLTAGATVSCAPRAGATGEVAVATCLADGFDLSRNMVHTGLALADRAVTTRYVPTEDKARQAKSGLWRGRFVAPWEWRRGKRLDGVE